MNRIIIFGCGNTGREILKYIGEERVCFYCDNNALLAGQTVLGNRRGQGRRYACLRGVTKARRPSSGSSD